MVRHICAWCGQPFMGIKIRKYHRRACQVAMYRLRKKEAQIYEKEAGV